MDPKPRLIVPELMPWRGSVMVTDPKAHAASLPHRIRKAASNVTVLDPFKVANGMARNRFNPLTLLESDEEPTTTEGD